MHFYYIIKTKEINKLKLNMSNFKAQCKKKKDQYV